MTMPCSTTQPFPNTFFPNSNLLFLLILSSVSPSMPFCTLAWFANCDRCRLRALWKDFGSPSPGSVETPVTALALLTEEECALEGVRFLVEPGGWFVFDDSRIIGEISKDNVGLTSFSRWDLCTWVPSAELFAIILRRLDCLAGRWFVILFSKIAPVWEINALIISEW